MSRSAKQARLFEEKEIPSEEETGRQLFRSECQFCTIANGKEQSRRVVYEDTISLAFLDRRPVFFGHCLVIPRTHFETLYDLPKDLIGPLFASVQLVGKAVQEAMKVDGTFIGINNKISQSIPHVHIHVVPRKHGDGLRGFFWPRRKYESEEQMNEIADSICKVVAKNLG